VGLFLCVVLVGQIIKAILHSSEKPFDVNWKMNRLRATLEDWMEIEFRNEYPEGFDSIALYSGRHGEINAYEDIANSPETVIGLLDGIMLTMKKDYPDCEPLLRLINTINVCIKLTKKS